MQILKMDFQSQSAPPVVPVMQSDAQSRFIGMALYNGGTPYKAPEGARGPTTSAGMTRSSPPAASTPP